MRLDTVIFGGGAAGLWLLDELVRSGRPTLLLESYSLGQGQTVASQGIIHGGLKYTLEGLLTRSAASIREMPIIWRDCLAGRRTPDLSYTRVRSDFCYLWHTNSVTSRLGMIGARFGLRVTPESLTRQQRPLVLSDCPGTVARIDEQVISLTSLLAALAAPHRQRILRIDADDGLAFDVEQPGRVRTVRLTDPFSQQQLELNPRRVVFAAGAGNAGLRLRVGLSSNVMQRRPLQMVMLRGLLPRLNGHCVDGAKTRVTITSDDDSFGRTVWQVGGQVAEVGIQMDEPSLFRLAKSELEAAIPGLDLSKVQWATYRIDRAEGSTPDRKRPSTVQILSDGNVITAWPTKLALVPRLAEEIATRLGPSDVSTLVEVALPAQWPRPHVARPPWETCQQWYELDRDTEQLRRAA